MDIPKHQARFLEFSGGIPHGDAREIIPAMYAFSVNTREEVDALTERALAEGGTAGASDQDLGFMYSRSFRDPDGHYFEVLWMDPAAAEQGPADMAEVNA